MCYSGCVHQILVYGDIGFEVTARAVHEALKAAGKAKTINVRINSFGGDAFEGLAIYNILRASGKRIEVDIDGIAASAASIVAMAGDEVRAAANAFMMIHNSSSLAIGNSKDMQDQADMMAKLDQSMAETYAKKSGRLAQEFRPLMDAETWFTADEAMTHGLVDKVTEAKKAAASGKAFESWKNAPAQVKANLQLLTPTAIVAEDHSMDEAKLQEILAAALAAGLAPLVARLNALEAAPKAETVQVEVTAPISAENASAESRKLFDAAVSRAYTAFTDAGKLAKNDATKTSFLTASKTAEGFEALCALYDASGPIVATQPIEIAAIKPDSKGKKVLSAAQLEFARKNHFDISKWGVELPASEGK